MMGFFKDFFAKKHDTEDEERGGTTIIFPERVMALILLVKKGAGMAKSEKEDTAFVWRIFRLVNPALYEVLPDRDQVKAYLYETGAMEADGYIHPDAYIDPLEEFEIPHMASSYIQTRRLARGEITIWLREARTADKEFKVELTEPLVTKGFMPSENATLMIIYASNTPELISSLWPALPKLLDQK